MKSLPHGHATNEALAEVASRIEMRIAQSEARQMRWTMTTGAFVIAAITIIDKVL